MPSVLQDLAGLAVEGLVESFCTCIFLQLGSQTGLGFPCDSPQCPLPIVGAGRDGCVLASARASPHGAGVGG